MRQPYINLMRSGDGAGRGGVKMLAARGVIVSHESIRRWALKFSQTFANEIRRRSPSPGDKWHLDEVVISIVGRRRWLWRAVDQNGVVLDILVQRRRDARAAKQLLRKRWDGRPPTASTCQGNGY